MFKSIFAPLIAVALFIVLVGLLTQGKLDNLINKTKLTEKTNQKTITIEDKTINVEVATTNDERAEGLANRTSLEENSGMVFVFDKNSKPIFWMKNTKIPLDIIWINDNKIVQIDKNVDPQIGAKDSELKKYPASSIVDYVLEVNGGYCDKNNIKVGQSLSGLEQL